MKTRYILLIAALIIAALAVFFAFQATPSHILNSPRASAIEALDGVLSISERYTLVESEVFAGKTDFSTVIFEGEVQLCERAFYGCPNLENIVFEKNADIGSEAFADCPSLKAAHIRGGTCAENAFIGHGGLTLYCPEGSEAESIALRMDMSLVITD